MVSGTPPRMNGSHSSMNAVLNRKAAKSTASRMKIRTHTAASLARNEYARGPRLQGVPYVGEVDGRLRRDQAPCFFVRS